jgi:hypothetical protein
MTFDLWMSQTRFHTFIVVMNFLNCNWFPCCVMIRLFEVPHTNKITLSKIVKLLIDFQLTIKVTSCVKNKGKNMATLNFSFFHIVSCNVFPLKEKISFAINFCN